MLKPFMASWVVLVFVVIVVSSSDADAQQAVDTSLPNSQPVSVLFLYDALWSMRGNDPQKLCQFAVQPFVSELSPDDQLAIVEFKAEAGANASESGAVWMSASRQSEIRGPISQVRDIGLFTVYRAGLLEAPGVYRQDTHSGRKLVLLLSDGVLDPNPRVAAYAPHNVTYANEVIFASKKERRGINATYLRILGSIVDLDLMRTLANETSVHAKAIAYI